MSKNSFAASAAHLAGLAALALGWRPREFWTSTPAELTAIFTALAQTSEVPPPMTPPDMATLAVLKEQFPDG